VSVSSQSGAKCADTRASAIVVRTFLDNTRSQLTYNGLFDLASLPTQSTGFSISASEPISPPPSSDPTPVAQPIPPTQPELFALFRNSHLAVLYRRAGRHNLDMRATDRLRRTGIARNGSPFGCLAQPPVLLLHYWYCTDTSFGSIARISVYDIGFTK
jgi:hypothetical protein